MSGSEKGAVPGAKMDNNMDSMPAAGPGDSKVLRNAISVDVEDYFHVSALAGSVDRGQWKDMEFRADASTDRLLELFDEFGVQGTFFVLGWVAEHRPDIVRRISSQGHEVACHGMSHRLVYKQSPQEFHDETRRSKTLLEDLTGKPVFGYRAASWSITSKSLWALDTIAELGFAYDSSIFPIRHDRYGIADSIVHPGHVTAPSGATVVEFPPTTVDWMGVRWPVAGGGYFRIFPYQFIRFGLRRVNQRSNQPFMFYLHPWEVDPQQPRIKTSWLSSFRHYTNLHRTESRLKRLLEEFPVTTAHNVLRDRGLLATG